MKDSSVAYSNCPSAYRTIWLYKGLVLASSVNSSNNIAYDYIGILVFPSTSCGFSDCLISFSCFSKNKATDYICVVYEIL